MGDIMYRITFIVSELTCHLIWSCGGTIAYEDTIVGGKTGGRSGGGDEDGRSECYCGSVGREEDGEERESGGSGEGAHCV